MHIVWLMIVFYVAGLHDHVALTTLEFADEHACRAAAIDMQNIVSASMPGHVTALCYPSTSNEEHSHH